MTWIAFLLSFMLAPAFVPQNPPVTTKGTGRIAGRVTAADDARPIVNALVRLVRWEGGLGQPQSRFTDTQGRFEFADLPGGSYQITVSAEGFVTLEYEQKQPPQPGRRIELEDGERFDKTDFQLPRTSAVEGQVLDEFGDAAPGVLIQVARVDFAAGRTRLMPVSSSRNQHTTDDQGRFRVFGLPAGDYYVLALSGLFANEDRAGFAPTFYPGTTIATDAQSVRLEPGRDATNLSFALTPAALTTVSGVAIDATGSPVAKAALRLYQTHGGDVRAVIDAPAISGPDGRFAFRNVPAGTYVLQGMSPPRRFGSVTLSLDGRPVSDLRMTLAPGVAVRGRIVFDGDAPLPQPSRVRVAFRSIDFVSGPVGGGPPTSRVNDDWTFEVSGMLGTGIIRMEPPPPWRLKDAMLNGEDVTDKPLTFRDRDIDNLQITLTSRQGTIAGVVLGANGQPTPQGVVIAFAEDAWRLTFPSRFIAMARPDDRGRYTLQGLPPETYLLVALPAIQGSEWQDPAFLETLRAASTKVVILEGSNVAQDLKLPKSF